MNLYHYTDAYGFLGILESGKLWATQADFMNDSEELWYGLQVIREVLNEYILIDQLHKHHPLLESLYKTFNEEKGYLVFLVCFCENDDLLSQWRAYGANGQGYSIGFSKDDLQQTSWLFEKVIYDKVAQKESIQKIIDSHLLNENPSDFYLEDNLKVQACLLKNPAFKEEQEWRLLYPITYWRPGMGRSEIDYKFRVSNGKIIPYKEFDIPKIKGVWGNAINAKSIKIGPTNVPLQTREALSALTYYYGIGSKIKVDFSKIPYR